MNKLKIKFRIAKDAFPIRFKNTGPQCEGLTDGWLFPPRQVLNENLCAGSTARKTGNISP